ncbi:MAG: polysaccharide biosynthesis tyrosine autokinase [Pseudomonadota bacterium]|nr:polysaccharide biosynthesis tyrosine autokinase [Pseudomonadota bacterium]
MNNELARTGDEPGWAIAGYAPSGATQSEERSYSPVADLNLAALLRIIGEWRWLVLSAVALGVAAAVIVTLLSTPLYRAGATLEANPPAVEIMDEQSATRAAATSWDFLATQVGLLQSRSLAERVAQDLNLASNEAFVDPEQDAVARLKAATSKVRAGLSVESPEEGQLIEISYVSDSPQLAAQIVNGLADGFIRSNLERRYEASSYARNFLERQIAKVRGELEASERQLVGYAQAQGIINTGGGTEGQAGSDVGSLQGESLVALNQALAAAVTRRIAAEGVYRQSRAAGNTAEVNASSAAMRQVRGALEAEYQEKLTLMKPDHPDMVSLRSRIDELDRQVRIENSQVAGGRSNSLLADFQAAASAERSLRAQVAQLKGSVLNLRGRSIQYTILQREVDTNRALYDALLQRYKEIGVAGGIGTNLISVVDRGEVPAMPHSPNLPLNLLIGLGLGLVAGLGAAVLLEFLNDTIKTRDDVRNKLGLACLGAIPKRIGKGSFVEDLKDPTSVVSEAYSSVLAALRFSTDAGAPKTLLITSTRDSEGKSSTALALSQNFARLGKKVLLIDSDLRKPTFKAATKKQGLAQLLTTDDAVRDHVVMTQYQNLWLMPCGAVPPNPADLLSTSRFHAILTEAAEHFDMVVVDAPPVLGLADAPLLAAVCNGTMMVVESGRARTQAVIAAINRLEASGSFIVGATLTKAQERSGGYGYGYEPYRYGVGRDDDKQILMIPHQGDA